MMNSFHDNQNIIRVPAKVLGCLRTGYLEVIVGHGIGLLDGGTPTEIPISIVPVELRMPNSQFTVVYDRQEHKYLSVEAMEVSDKIVAPEITPDAIAEAKRNPGGWVYAIDGHYDPNGAVPPEAIKGAWKVDERGQIVGQFIPNPNYRKGK